MSILETINNRTGARRYFVDGRRVTRDALDTVKFARRLDAFTTTTRGDVTRHRCEVRP